jgi:hypothetical protein
MTRKMDTKKNLVLKFHQNLGKLFFAMAAIDGSVRREEIDKLKEIVDKEWLLVHFDDDNLKLEAEQAIVNTFLWLYEDNEYNAEECYSSFLLFKNEHKALFTIDINKLIIKTARAIASSFSKVNKSELMLLARLDIELKK